MAERSEAPALRDGRGLGHAPCRLRLRSDRARPLVRGMRCISFPINPLFTLCST
jgi:hypothetical protein